MSIILLTANGVQSTFQFIVEQKGRKTDAA